MLITYITKLTILKYVEYVKYDQVKYVACLFTCLYRLTGSVSFFSATIA